MKNESAQGIINACNGYSKQAATTRFALSRVQQKRLILLMYWVKDRYRTRELYSFDTGADEISFLSEIQDVYNRYKSRESRESQRTVGMALLGNSFSVQLESRHQWKQWIRELEDMLSSVIGVSRVPLSYVICDIATPTLLGFSSWEEKVIRATPITGRNFKQDSKTVHNIILKIYRKIWRLIRTSKLHLVTKMVE